MQISRVLFLAFNVAVGVNALVKEEKRQAPCNADNVLRALRSQSSEAASLCPSLILFDATKTVTVAAAGVTPAPVIVTSTSTIIRSVYPDGRTLEQLRFPTGVTSFPASRVSSACSCFLGTTSTITTSVTSPTITRTTIITSRATLTGSCATNTPYVGAYSAEPVINNRQRLNTDFIGLSNAYDCCKTCQTNANCVAYFNVPGVSCNTLTVDPGNSDACQAFFSLSRVFVSPARYPNNLGGKGPCGSSADIQVVGN
ncbi:hypothetical protein MMC29_003381 [Sticta canariensis]|nr:hypothetical protein [Sticta canariensis]